MPARDLSWHRAQSAALDAQGLRKALTGRMKRGDYRAAVVYLTRLYQLAPEPEAAQQLGQLQLRCRDYRAALDHLQHARQQWPGDLALLRLGAETAMLAQDFRSAQQLWQHVIAQNRGHGAYPVLRLLACLRQTGHVQTADQIITRHAMVLRQSMNRVGMQLLRRGRSDFKLPRGLYLVAGNNGTGKTTLGHMLQALGFPILDADTAIASFCLHRRYSDVRYDLERRAPQEADLIRWSWPDSRVTECFAKARQRRDAVFVIGGFGKAVEPYCDRFRQIFHLWAPDHVIADRLAARGSVHHRPGSHGYDAALRRNAREQHPAYTNGLRL